MRFWDVPLAAISFASASTSFVLGAYVDPRMSPLLFGLPGRLVAALEAAGISPFLMMIGAAAVWAALFLAVFVRRTTLALAMALFAPLAVYYPLMFLLYV